MRVPKYARTNGIRGNGSSKKDKRNAEEDGIEVPKFELKSGAPAEIGTRFYQQKYA